MTESASKILLSVPRRELDITQIKTLLLGWNRLESVPLSLGYLTNLTVLGLDNNQIEYVNDNFGKFTNLLIY